MSGVSILLTRPQLRSSNQAFADRATPTANPYKLYMPLLLAVCLYD